MKVTWEDASRWDWGKCEVAPGESLTLEPQKVQVGCLQRIATALEEIGNNLTMIARCLDPANAASNEQAKRDSFAIFAHEQAARSFRKGLLKKMMILPYHLPSADRQKIAALAVSLDLASYGDNAEAHRAALEAFDPLSFDWSKVKMGKKTRERLERGIASAKVKASEGGGGGAGG